MSRRYHEQLFSIAERSFQNTRQNLRTVPPVLLCPTPGRTRCPCNKVDSGLLPGGHNPVLTVLPLNRTIARTCAYAPALPLDKSGWGQDTRDRVSKLPVSKPSASLSEDRVSSPGWDRVGQAGQTAGVGWSA